MAYPWPSFEDFLFTREEQPIFGSDTGWQRDPSYARSRPLGSNIDSIVTLAIGSAIRSWECYLSPSRFTVLEALVNYSGTLTDWANPTPDSRGAFLLRVTPIDQYVSVTCSDGTTQQRVRTRVEFISQ